MTTYHSKFEEVTTLVNAGIAVLLSGEKGSGKTTLAKQIAEKLNLKFYSISMTRQTTLSHLMGFMSVNGTYVESLLYYAVTEGGMVLIDEINAADPNVLLSLNTIENGYVSFPTGIVECHKDFRIVATQNPADHTHTGRAKLDAATLDRFDEVDIDRDANLEKSLVDGDTFRRMTLMRECLRDTNSSIKLSMRDSKRYQQRKELGLLDGFVWKMFDKSQLVFSKYEERIRNMPKHANQSDCITFDELFDLAKIQSKDT